MAISEETKANAECLLRYMVRDGLLIPLEECLANFEFRGVECASDEEMSFAFRLKSLAAVDTLALFAEFLERVGDKVVLTGRSAFTICQLLARANNNTKKEASMQGRKDAKQQASTTKVPSTMISCPLLASMSL